MNGQLTFDDARPVVGSTRTTRRPTTRDLIDRLWRLAAAARRCDRCPDVDDALAALDALGAVSFEPVDNGTGTSRRAAHMTAPRTGSQRAKVLDAIRDAPGGLTDDQLEERLGMRHQSLSARRRELALGGFIVGDGTRPTRSGAQATVWRLP